MALKTTFQNLVDEKFGSITALSKKTKTPLTTVWRDYHNKNGLKQVQKYCKKLKWKSIDLKGYEYGMHIELSNVKIT